MKVATYNVNSVNARLDNLCLWLRQTSPDAVFLQEIKCEYNNFPFFELQALGYQVHILGQRSYNGVALLTKGKSRVVCEGLPDFADDNARYLELETAICGYPWRLASIYLPNGNPPYNAPNDNEKFAYKLRFMQALNRHAANLLLLSQPVLLGGDFNVILTDADVYNPELFSQNALCRPEARRQMRALLHLGYFDCFRSLHPQDIGYTFWDYSGNALAADFGMRIDYLLANSFAADRLQSCQVDKAPRQADKPSDHTPLTAEFADD